MKRIALFLALAFSCISLFAQEIITIESSAVNVIPDLSGETALPKEAIDTIDTKDKFTKIILFNDHTWENWDLGKPVIDEDDFYEGWDTSKIHAFKELTLKDLPDEVDLLLVDSLHSYFAPYIGTVRSRFAFRGSREHQGTDIPLHIGDSIRAAFDGVVRVVEVTRNSGGYGNLVVLRHPNGLETYYGHLSKHLVETGELVKAGEVIGLGGNTGRSTGPHLHFETRYLGKPFDPERIIDFETGALRDSLLTLHKHYFSIYSHYGQTDQESEAAAGRVLHTIRSGDTLGGLAIKYGTTVRNICSLNGINTKTVLRVGRRLIVR